MYELTLKNIKQERLGRIHSDVAKSLQVFEGLILGGGAIRDALFGNVINDYDMFLKDTQDVDEVKRFFEIRGYRLAFACPEGKLFTYVQEEGGDVVAKVQIILKRRYNNKEDLINSFDFSVTYFAMTFDKERDDYDILTSYEAISDVRKKRIRLVNLEYPSSTINRLYKYRERGYYTGDVIKEIVVAIVNMEGYDHEDDALYID